MEIKNHIMNIDNYDKFCNQLIDVVKEFPSLSINEQNGKKYLKGVLDIADDDTNIIGSYLIEIRFSELFPFRFPILYEIGNDIPNNPDWHKYSDNSCCITVLPDEIIKCKSGISVNDFIKRYCCSFFANHIYRKKENHYLNDEYSHGSKGLKEFYTTLLRTDSKEQWISFYNHVFGVANVKYNRNDKCFCGSNKKFKICHLKIFDIIRDIGKKYFWTDLISIYPLFYLLFYIKI